MRVVARSRLDVHRAHGILDWDRMCLLCVRSGASELAGGAPKWFVRGQVDFRMIRFASVGLLISLFCATHAAASDVTRGRTIYQTIISRYPGLTLYLESGLMGENARLVADVPRARWKAMSTDDRHALAAFVRSELATVRSSPARYSLTPSTAPIWPTHRAAFERICDSCWEIHTGRYDRRTRSLGDDWTVAVKGDAPRETARSGPMLHEPSLQPLTGATATIGTKLYNAAGVHEATIMAVDLPRDRITVRFVRNGAREPKMLSAVSQFWFVKR